jgi:hypothetical protein
VNTNQHIDLFQNQIMGFSIFHSDVVPFEILAMHTRCKKGFITYYKSNDITTMKKHVDFDHFALLKKLLENAPKFPLDHEPNKKNPHAYFHLQYLVFFSITSKIKKGDATKVGFLEDLMLFAVKRLQFMKSTKSI